MLHCSAGSCRSTSLPTERALPLPVGERPSDDFDIRNGCGVEPHFAVHRWGKEQRCFGGERDGCQGVVGKTVSELRNNIRSSGCNQKEIGVIGEFDMSGMPARLFVKDAGSDRIARQGLQRQWSNKLDRTRGHHHVHGAILLRQFARYIGSLVRRNRSCHAEDDVHWISFAFCVLRLGRVEKALAFIEADMLRWQRLEPSLTYSKPKTQNSKLLSRHSTFWTCSRIFSNSALQWTTS